MKKFYTPFILILYISFFLFSFDTQAASPNSDIQNCKDRGWYDSAKIAHQDIDFDQLVYQSFDPTTLEKALEMLQLAAHTPGLNKEAETAYDHIIEEIDFLMTNRSINSLRYYNDVTNEAYAQIDLDLSAQLVDYADQATSYIKDALLSENCGASLSAYINDSSIVDYFLSYHPLSDETKALLQEENKLIQSYNDASMADYSVNIDGKNWTTTAFYEHYQELETDQFMNVYTALAKEKNKVCGTLFLELVALRNQIAQLEGYENYAEYSYYEIYGRDYSPKDIQQVYNSVKKHILPAMNELYTLVDAADTESLSTISPSSGAEVVACIAPYIAKIDPALEEAFSYLETHKLYDMDPSPTKMAIGYTDMLYSYGAPIIFNCPSGTYQDIETLIHEFGHYNNSYHNAEHALTDIVNTDVAEIHSQGLELLFFDYADELYGNHAVAVQNQILYTLCCSVIDGCLYDEFQNIIYSASTPYTLTEINQLFYELATSYGYQYYDQTNEDYVWVETPHTFQSPMYYISYATSALSALDLFGISLENRQLAIDQYMYLTTFGLDTPYREVVTKAGLKDIFSDASIQSISQSIIKYSVSISEQSSENYTYIYVILFVVIFIIILVTFIIIANRKRKQSN